MIAEAIEKILSLAKANVVEHGSLSYSDKELNVIKPPILNALSVHTLKAIPVLITEQFEGAAEADDGIFIHVVSPTHVDLLALISDEHGRRKHYVSADCARDMCKFPYGNFIEPEQFIIGLQSMFLPEGGDIDYLLRIASHLTSESISTSEDDGFSQKTAIRKGVALKDEAVIRPRVKLAPYRTFREVDQPVSEFIFRLRQRDGQAPLCALIDADGGKWQLEAVDSVAAWLARNTDKEVKVIS